MPHSLLRNFTVMIGSTLERERSVLSSNVAKEDFMYYAKALFTGSDQDSF